MNKSKFSVAMFALLACILNACNSGTSSPHPAPAPSPTPTPGPTPVNSTIIFNIESSPSTVMESITITTVPPVVNMTTISIVESGLEIKGGRDCILTEESPVCSLRLFATSRVSQSLTFSAPGYQSTSYIPQTKLLLPLIFITESSWSGDLGGLSGANDKCNADANLPAAYSNIPFSAVLESNDSTLGRNNVSFFNESGIFFATSPNMNFGLGNNNVPDNYSLITIPDGQSSNLNVWTGSSNNGTRNNCGMWSSSLNSKKGTIGTAAASGGNNSWAVYNKMTCDQQAKLYCVSQ